MARIDGRQRAVGVLAEVGVAGRVEQVEGETVALEGHHRACDRDTALLLDLHPVGPRAATLAAGLDVAGEPDGPARHQQAFGQRRLAGVGMRDDGEGSPCLERGAGLGCRRRARFCNHVAVEQHHSVPLPPPTGSANWLRAFTFLSSFMPCVPVPEETGNANALTETGLLQWDIVTDHGRWRSPMLASDAGPDQARHVRRIGPMPPGIRVPST